MNAPDPAKLAAKHFPDNPTLQKKLIDAIALVRSTTNGWRLDKQQRVQRITRKEPQQ